MITQSLHSCSQIGSIFKTEYATDRLILIRMVKYQSGPVISNFINYFNEQDERELHMYEETPFKRYE